MQVMQVMRVSWNAEAEQGLRVSAGADLGIIRQEVEAGVCELWHCISDSDQAYVVTRRELPKEWVLVCGEGSGFHEFAPVFIKAAKARKLSIRTHVKRRGMIKLWARYGLNLDEFVLRG